MTELKVPQVGSQAGYSLIEVLVVASLVSILMSIAALNFRELESPADSAGRALLAYFKSVQGKAMATTSTYTVHAVSPTEIRAVSASACSSAEQVEDAQLRFRLPSGARLVNTDWITCYNSRGLANNSIDISVRDSTVTKVIHLVLGGGIKLE